MTFPNETVSRNMLQVRNYIECTRDMYNESIPIINKRKKGFYLYTYSVRKHYTRFFQTSFIFFGEHEKIKSCFKASPFTRDSYLWLMNRAVSFCLRNFPFSEHYAQIGSSLLAAAMRFRKSRSVRHILCANKSQVYPAIKTFHGKTNKFLSKRCYIWREIQNAVAIVVHINKNSRLLYVAATNTQCLFARYINCSVTRAIFLDAFGVARYNISQSYPYVGTDWKYLRSQ